MKFKHVILTVLAVVLLDQVLKIYIKTHFTYDDKVNVIGNWFKLQFIENEGMAFGLQFGGFWGKFMLTLFRIVAVIIGFYYIKQLIKQGYKNGLIFLASLILAGALGNAIDCIFYGKIFTNGFHHPGKLVALGEGYGDWFQGKVVDMLSFPIFEGKYPTWVPFVGGQDYLFFKYIFNIADFAISTGVISIFVFQKKLLQKNDVVSNNEIIKEENIVTENQMMP